MNKISLPVAYKVKEVVEENYRTKTFVLDGRMEAKPGQFVMVWVPGQAEKPFSLTDFDPLTITVMEVGKFTGFLNAKIKVGDKLWFRGPFGDGVYDEVTGKKVMLAGGAGCVPLYCLAKNIKDKKNVKVLLGGRNKRELMFEKRFKDLGFEVVVCTDDGSQGIRGTNVDELKKVLGESGAPGGEPLEKIDQVYGCGPDGMIKAAAKVCENNKVAYQMSYEALMKCGFGVCGACSRGGELVCKDGPVFRKILK